MDISTISAALTSFVDCKNLIPLAQNAMSNPVGLISNAFLVNQIKDILEKKLPFLHYEWKFWYNIDKFFNGGALSESDKQTLICKLSNEANRDYVGKKIIEIIGSAETDKKLVYILNTTRVLITNDSLNLPMYFRICNTISHTLEEDLQFLNAHIDEKTIGYSIEVSGLITAGLAYDRGFSENNAPSYAFTDFAKIINEYALKGDGEKKIEEFNLNKPPQTSFLTTANIATDEEMKQVIDEALGNNNK